MKLSVRWIFDHLKADYKKYDITTIVQLLTSKTAEVEAYYPVIFDFKNQFIATVQEQNQEQVKLFIPELKKEVIVSLRTDAVIGQNYLIKQVDTKFEWVTLADWYLEKEGLLPAFHVEKKQLEGGWKKEIQTDDYIIEVDNKSVTHRPDLWGHRGFARELSVLLNIPLKDERSFLADIPVKSVTEQFKATTQMPYSVAIKASKACNRFAVLSIPNITPTACLPWMAVRLSLVGNRPIDAIVDATNYVMFDLGQPIHAFDAVHFATKTIEPQMAKKDEKLELLDGTVVTLTPNDLVITDGKKPVALAGIMGGKTSGVSVDTRALLVEAAQFDAATVRKSAAYHKVRTEASARFEKTLDPHGNVAGIERFVQLLGQAKITFETAPALISVGAVPKPVVLKLAHATIEQKLGTQFTEKFVIQTLEKLGFIVKHNKGFYTITVPTHRSAKDVTLPEDIVEEIARMYGYDNLPEQLPSFITTPKNQTKQIRQNLIKEQLAFGAAMHEVENYALFDNEFLKQINFTVEHGATLKNPLTEQRTTLVTSLVPHLLQNLEQNKVQHDELRFFEWARTWQQSKKKLYEQEVVAGIFYHKKMVDFYTVKQQLTNLFNALNLDVAWCKAEKVPQWANKHQTADLYCNNQFIGTAGMVAQRLMARLSGGQVFAFELNGEQLVQPVDKKKYQPLSKYQATSLDMSMMVPKQVTVAQLTQLIAQADPLITDVVLIDEFHKPEWEKEKSITMRFWMQDHQATLTKVQIDAGYQKAVDAVTQQGAVVR